MVLELWGTDWDATISFKAARQVRLDFRRYQHAGDRAVELDLEQDTYQIVAETGREGALPEAPLAEVAKGLEASSCRSAAAYGPTAPASVAPRPWAAWRAALLILVGACTAIGLAGYLSWQAERQHRPSATLLAPLPAFPSKPGPPTKSVPP